MRKILATSTAALALAGVAVAGLPGAPGTSSATAAGCSTWQYKIKSATSIASWNYSYYRWNGVAYKGYYVTTSRPWKETVYLGEQHAPRKLMRLNKVYTAGKSDITDKFRDDSSPVYIAKDSRLDYVRCW